MEIYIVQKGDTIDSIAEKYNVTVTKLIRDNDLNNPNNLVIGQTIVIAHPKQTYIVEDGDTLESIADKNGVTVMQILRNNSFLAEREYIYHGEELIISYDTNGTLTTNGIIYPFIKKETLYKVLPNLTYLSVFNFRAIEKGEVISYYDDADVIQKSKEYGTIPLMVLSTLTLTGGTNIEIAYEIAENEEYQDHMIADVLVILKNRGYEGLNMIFNFITVSNQAIYTKFINRVAKRIREEGYLYFATINPSLEKEDNEASLEKIDYSGISDNVNGIIFLKYVWGTNYGPPSPVSSIHNIRITLDYAVTMLPRDKITIGTPIISYDWQLPYIPGESGANSLTIDSALQLAAETSSVIEFDEPSQTPFFKYDLISVGPPFHHIVWSFDARSVDAWALTVKEYSLYGMGFWNVMIFYQQMWLVINSQYEIIKMY